MNRLDSKITLVTGANSGLGKATALALAKLGARVVMVCRSRQRGEAARADIMAESGSQAVDLLVADLSSQADIHRLAEDFQACCPRLDVLVNNVGGSFPTRRETVDGIEYTLALNHLAPFLLTNLLLDTLKASAPARIVNVGTRISATMDLDDLQFRQRPYRSLQAYSQSKLGNILFTYELARRLEGSGVTVNCVHPGVFKSNLGRDEGPEAFIWRLIGWLGQRVLPDPEQAAGRILYLAASPEVEGISGRYFGDRREIQSPEQTYDLTVQRRLWHLSAELTGLNVEQQTRMDASL